MPSMPSWTRIVWSSSSPLWVFIQDMGMVDRIMANQLGVPAQSSFFKKIWATIFFIILLSLWKERNHRIFTNSSSSIKDLKDLVLLRLGWWISGWNEGFPHSPMDIVRNPACLQWNYKPSLGLTSLPSPKEESWSPPPSHTIKWNVDASMNPLTSRAAIGGVLRNHSGNFMCLFSLQFLSWKSTAQRY